MTSGSVPREVRPTVAEREELVVGHDVEQLVVLVDLGVDELAVEQTGQGVRAAERGQPIGRRHHQIQAHLDEREHQVVGIDHRHRTRRHHQHEIARIDLVEGVADLARVVRGDEVERGSRGW